MLSHGPALTNLSTFAELAGLPHRLPSRRGLQRLAFLCPYWISEENVRVAKFVEVPLQQVCEVSGVGNAAIESAWMTSSRSRILVRK